MPSSFPQLILGLGVPEALQRKMTVFPTTAMVSMGFVVNFTVQRKKLVIGNLFEKGGGRGEGRCGSKSDVRKAVFTFYPVPHPVSHPETSESCLHRLISL